MSFIHVIGKPEFSASLLQSSGSHDPSEIIVIYWFSDQETFLIVNSFKTVQIEILNYKCIYSQFWSIQCVFAE